MKRLPIQVMALLIFTCLTGTAWSKGAITKIVIKGGADSESVEITDSKILKKFTIWSGPGVGGWDMAKTVPPPGTPKFIADWTKGIVSDQPSESTPYLVKMYIEGREAPNNTYEVLYVFNGDTDDGYVYLPSPVHDDFGKSNMYQIARSVESNWFRSTDEWDDTVRPLLKGR